MYAISADVKVKKIKNFLFSPYTIKYMGRTFKEIYCNIIVNP